MNTLAPGTSAGGRRCNSYFRPDALMSEATASGFCGQDEVAGLDGGALETALRTTLAQRKTPL